MGFGALFFLTLLLQSPLLVAYSPYAPFVMETDTGLVGLDVILIRRFAQTYGYTLHFRKYSIFQEMLQAVERGEVDLAIGMIHITEERKKRFLMTEPYLYTGLVVVTLRGGKRIRGPDELDGWRLGVKQGATGHRWADSLKEVLPNLQVIPFLTTESSFQALENREIDAVMNDYLNTKYLILQGAPYQIAGSPVTSTGVGFPVAPGRYKLLYQLNQFLKKATQSSEFYANYEAFFF